MRKIIQFFTNEHLLGNLLTFMLLAFGIFSIYEIRRDLYPNVSFDTTIITAILPGASPEQVENLLINPIEESLRKVDGIKKLMSTATESTATLVIQLDNDARDSQKTNRDIRRSIDTIKNYPSDAEDPIVQELEVNQFPIITVSLSKKSGFDNDFLDLSEHIYEELSEVEGVAGINKLGLRDKEIHIRVNNNKIKERRIDLLQIISAIKNQNISLPGGSSISTQGKEILIRTDAEYKSSDFFNKNLPNNPEKNILQQIKNTIIKSNDGGYSSTVGQIANVEYSLKKPEKLYKSFGEEAVHLIIKKKFNADVLDTVSRIRKKAEDLQKRVGSNLDIRFSNDLSIYVDNRLNILKSNLIIGLILVIIVLSLFLPWQATIVVAVGIPVALFSAFTVLYISGHTINLLSLVGLIIVLGMLVDDAIVVCENIWRHVEMQKPIKQAVVDGAREVFVPVFGSVLTTMSAFGPMLFMTGMFGAFIWEIPFVVLIALSFSLFEAFIIMPSHFASWVGAFINQEKLKKSAKAYKAKNSAFDKFIKKYGIFIEKTIRWRYAMTALIVLLLIGSVSLQVATGRFILFPSDGLDFFFIHVEAPQNTSLKQMSKLIQPIEDKVSQLSSLELSDHTTTIGIIQQDANDPQTRRGSNYANIRVILKPSKLRERDAKIIANELKEQIGHPKGINKIKIEYPKAGPPQGRAVSINIMGKDFKKLTQLSEIMKVELKKIKGLSDIRSSFLPGKEEWRIKPDQQKMSFANLNATQIATSVRAAFEGIVASSIRNLNNEIDIRVLLKEKKGPALEKLNQLHIGNPLGNLIPLNQVADFNKHKSLNSISHKNFKRVINISAEVDGIDATATKVASKLQTQLDSNSVFKNNKAYSIEFGGEKEDTQDSLKSLGIAFIFAAGLIFFLLVSIFKNLVQPFLIFSSIPLGFIGVVIAMFVHNRPLSFMALLGVIALAGVIVNNSIVIIDFINKLRSEGVSKKDSIVQAASVRLRPIMLTSITTVCGLLPTAYGDIIYKLTGYGGSDPFIIPITLSLGWGLAFGSILTILFFPSFVAISDDISRSGTYLKKLIFKS